MLTNANVAATLPVVDLARARNFYEGKLGLKAGRVDPPPSPGVEYLCGGGSRLYLYQRGATKADHTVAMFKVDNVEAEVKELKAKGVVFQELDMPEMGIKTAGSIAVMGSIKGAWFNDTEGNTLGVAEDIK